LNELASNEEFLIETTHYAIALKEMGLLKTRFLFIALLEANQ
jgi:hypothetical protein